MNRQLTLFAITLLGAAVMYGAGNCFAGEDDGSSSFCIQCHSDLEEMDSFGAAAASGGAAIAG